MAYSTFRDLPSWLEERVFNIAGNQSELWVDEKIPALGERSIIEVMNLKDGEQRIRAYLSTVNGHFRCTSLDLI